MTNLATAWANLHCSTVEKCEIGCQACVVSFLECELDPNVILVIQPKIAVAIPESLAEVCEAECEVEMV